MFVIVYNNSVILGPMRWNRFRFENVIEEECEFSTTLPKSNDSEDPIIVSDDIKILPVQGSPNPEFNSKIEFLQGPFWEFTETAAIFSYTVESLNIDAVKNFLKDQVAAERWRRENAGVKVTINNTEYTFNTDRETRVLLSSATDGMNWKVDRETWVNMTKIDVDTVSSVVFGHVQSCFDWEFTKLQEIDACATVEELDVVVIVEDEQEVM